MRTRIGLPALLAVATLTAAYQYYFTDTLTSVNLANWYQNGSLTATPDGLTAPDSNGGSLISKVGVPGGYAEYEVKSTLTLAASGGTYVTYLRASSDALSGSSPQGSYYAWEIQNPTFSGSACTATLALYKRVSGTITLLASSTIPCRNGMVVRAMALTGGRLQFVADGTRYGYVTDTSIATGQPGIGARATPSGNAIAGVNLGPMDRAAPSAVVSSSVGSSVFPNRAELQWQGAADDANGIGIFCYQVWRGSTLLGCPSTAEFADASLSPSTSYQYSLYAVDWHQNLSPATAISINTPASGQLDPRRVGVRPTGAYWGSGGEQIDAMNGNLNYTLPLLRAQGRGGSGVTFSLSYNSQLWRKDTGGAWKLGRDVGYGFGWRLMAGSLTPY